MAELDFIEEAVNEYMQSHSEEQQQPEGGGSNEPIEQVAASEIVPEGGTPVADDQPIQTPQAEKPVEQVYTPETVLQEFNKLTGLSFSDIEQVKAFAEQAELFPDLVKAVESLQNPLTYFKDETSFKVNQLAKDPRYNGKEHIIESVLKNDLEKLPDVTVIELAAKLSARDGVRNPLRAELRSMGLDPDAVLDDYESLDDDTKDLLKIRADKFREELPKIADNVKVPEVPGNIIEKLNNEKSRYKEDLDAAKVRVAPVSDAIISEIKEIEFEDGFNFKVDLTPEQKQFYSGFLTDLIVSGEYDLETDQGKDELYGAVMDMLKADFFKPAMQSYKTFLISKTEEQLRNKYDNAKPLEKSEPPNPQRVDNESPEEKAAQAMISFFNT